MSTTCLCTSQLLHDFLNYFHPKVSDIISIFNDFRADAMPLGSWPILSGRKCFTCYAEDLRFLRPSGVLPHVSMPEESFWQRTKVGGTAIRMTTTINVWNDKCLELWRFDVGFWRCFLWLCNMFLGLPKPLKWVSLSLVIVFLIREAVCNLQALHCCSVLGRDQVKCIHTKPARVLPPKTEFTLRHLALHNKFRTLKPMHPPSPSPKKILSSHGFWLFCWIWVKG